jgi:hypothetical protein
MRFGSGQQNGDQAPLSICECVLPSTRAAKSLLLFPLFRPPLSGAL